jgi:hydroxypyruvate isomerase
MVFRDLPVEERVRRVAGLGFAVEIWDWTKHDVGVLERSGAVFSSMTGYVRGGLVEEEDMDELLRTAEQSIPVAKRLGCPRLNLHGTGLGEGGLPVKPVHEVTGAMWLAARRTLGRVAELGERAASPSCSRTSTPRSTTPVCPSRVPPTRWPWSRGSAARRCG